MVASQTRSARSNSTTDGWVLVAGGDEDPNIRRMMATLSARDVPYRALLVGDGITPRLDWNIEDATMTVEGERLEPRSAFLRHDVFTHLGDGRQQSAYRAFTWYSTLTGWLATRPDIRTPNHGYLTQTTNKPQVLHLARQAGLKVPPTRVTNDVEGLESFEPGKGKIAKPVNGGGYCQDLAEIGSDVPLKGGRAAAPAIVQPKLINPEFRVYAVGGRFLGFHIESESLDYRENQDARVRFEPNVPSHLCEGLTRLMRSLDMDYGAADFKTCAESGELCFLEINSAPMFGSFDADARGQLLAAIIEYLTEN